MVHPGAVQRVLSKVLHPAPALSPWANAARSDAVQWVWLKVLHFVTAVFPRKDPVPGAIQQVRGVGLRLGFSLQVKSDLIFFSKEPHCIALTFTTPVGRNIPLLFHPWLNERLM